MCPKSQTPTLDLFNLVHASLTDDLENLFGVLLEETSLIKVIGSICI